MKLLLVAGLCITTVLSLGAQAGHAWSPLAYQWPVKPFDRQHPIRGGFGDPRTFTPDQPFGVTGPADRGDYSFHNGVDIVAATGTPVYPVVSGHVIEADSTKIVVDAGNGRSFGYWHLLRHVRLGENVVAGRTVLGWIQKRFEHVHLTEVDDGRTWNPLAPGHLEPYRDHTAPQATALDFSDGRHPDLTVGGVVGGNRNVAIEAVDEPAMRVPGSFSDLPQAPALVQWRLFHNHVWTAWHTAADFRSTEPAERYFWTVYAAGTYQNVPVFNRELYVGTAGQYLFRTSLDTSRLEPGRYELEARVADIRGNASTTTWPFTISRARLAGARR